LGLRNLQNKTSFKSPLGVVLKVSISTQFPTHRGWVGLGVSHNDNSYSLVCLASSGCWCYRVPRVRSLVTVVPVHARRRTSSVGQTFRPYTLRKHHPHCSVIFISVNENYRKRKYNKFN